MTDDLVKRLRDVPHDFSLNSELRCIAADRIEKLEAELHSCFHRIEELQAALRPFAEAKLPSMKRSEIDFNEWGLRCLMSPMEIARLKARKALEGKE